MAPAAVRTRPAWPAWTSVHALAFHPDGRRHLRCHHHDRGYPRQDGYRARLRLGRHRSLDGFPERHRRDAERTLRDGHQVRDAHLRGRLDVRLEHQDARRDHPWGHPDAAYEEHQDAVPGTGCYHPYAEHRDAVPGTGCYRPDADAAWAYRTAWALLHHPRRVPQVRRRVQRELPVLRAWLHPVRRGSQHRPLRPVCWALKRQAKKPRVRPQAMPTRRRGLPRVRAPRRRRQAWVRADAVRPAWAHLPPWGSRVPERVPWRQGRPHGPYERRGLPVSRTVP